MTGREDSGVSVPFSATYHARPTEALGEDYLRTLGNTAALVGMSPVAVEVRGILRTTAETLEVEYRATRAQVMAIVAAPRDRDLKTVSIPLKAVASVTGKRGLFRKPRLIIEFNRLDIVPSIPWSETSRVTFTIERRDASRARELGVSLEMLLADADLRRLQS